MMRQLTNLRAAAAVAVLGAMALAGCGGGSSSVSMLPAPVNAATNSVPTLTTQNGKTVQAGTLSFAVPTKTGTQAQSSARAAVMSTSKKPTFIDTTTLNSTIVVSVTPQNPAEAAQYGNLTVCYNLYTNGVLAPAAPPNFTYTTNGANVAATVTIAIPAPPGTDGYQITQYAGQCGSTPYTLPTPPPGNIGSSNILAQTPLTYADIEPGVVNNLNNQIANCPAQTVPCPLGLGPVAVPPAGVLVASVAIANIQFGALPIPSPVREQGNFIAVTAGKIGIPIPLEATTASGVVIPGLTTTVNLLAGAGPFPSGVVVTSNDTTTHTALYLVDATTGQVAQAAASNATGLTIHEFNALSGAASTGGNDNLTGLGTPGDPWIIIMTFDGVGPSVLSSVTVTATATIPPATSPTSVTATITPQAAVYSAGGSGYADAANPTAPLGLIQVGTSNYFTDGNSVKIDGTAPGAASTATALGGLASATWPNATTFVYAVDSAQASGSTTAESASGLYAYSTNLATVVPVSAAAGANNYIQFPNPVAVVQAQGTAGATHPYLFVVDKNGGIYRVDVSGASEVAPVGGFQEATNVLPVIATSGTALNPSGNKMVGTATLAGGQFLVADPGNNRIAEVDATQNPAVISSWASCPSCTGLFMSGTSAYASSSTGQIYYISAAGATAVSLGFATGTAIDGPIGQVASFTPTATPTLTASNYGLQFQAKSFFDTANNYVGATGASYATLAAPYTVLPFPGGKAVAATPTILAGFADTSAGGTTGAGLIKATGGLVVVPAATANGAVVTSDSILFVDAAGKLRTIVR